MRNFLLAGALRPARRLLMPLISRWPWPVRTKLSGGSIIYVSLASAIGRGLVATGEFDPAVRSAIEAALAPGGVFVDVGANVGYYTLRARQRVGETGEVHAFEIDLRSSKLLQRTVKANDWDNVTVHHCGLADRAGAMSISQPVETGHTAVVRGGSEGLAERPVQSLDAMLVHFEERGLNCLKIDVEGFETEVVRGATDVIRGCSPVIICETEGSNREEIGRLLAPMGYIAEEIAGAYSPCTAFRRSAA